MRQKRLRSAQQIGARAEEIARSARSKVIAQLIYLNNAIFLRQKGEGKVLLFIAITAACDTLKRRKHLRKSVRNCLVVALNLFYCERYGVTDSDDWWLSSAFPFFSRALQFIAERRSSPRVRSSFFIVFSFSHKLNLFAGTRCRSRPAGGRKLSCVFGRTGRGRGSKLFHGSNLSACTLNSLRLMLIFMRASFQ